MKKGKIIVYILFILLLIPFAVNAEVCTKDDIKIESIETVETRGNIEEISNPTNDNNQVNLNTKMNVIGDSITYKVVLKNTSNSDYVFDKNSLEKDYINYDITYEDESNIIKSGEEKVIFLRLNYSNKPQEDDLSNGVLSKVNNVSFNLIKEKGDSLINPETGNKMFYIIFIIAIMVSIVLIKSKRNVSLGVLVIALLLIPQLVKASCTCTLDINLNLEIDAKEAIFLPGQELNIKMKQLAGTTISNPTYPFFTNDYNISSINYSEIEPTESNKEDKNIVSTIDSKYPIYMWYEDGTIYWWSEDNTPSLNEDASYMFAKMLNLEDTSGIESLDTTKVKKLSYFLFFTHVTNLDAFQKWDVSRVEDLTGLFRENHYLTNANGIKNWDVRSVKNMTFLFLSCYSIEIIDLSNWETSSLTNFSNAFGMWTESGGPYPDAILKKIILSNKFDTSKVITMYALLANNHNIEDYSFLKYLDVSSNTTFQQFFQDNSNMKDSDLLYIKNWNVSNASTMASMFNGVIDLTTLNGLEDWDVSNVTNMNYMFKNNTNLQDVSAINDWNISPSASFVNMFPRTIHPEFSKVNGSWDNQGTFTPE